MHTSSTVTDLYSLGRFDAPPMVYVTKVMESCAHPKETSSESTHTDTNEAEFLSWLDEAKNCDDPFDFLTKKCTKVTDVNWSSIFTHSNGCAIECKLALDVWDSTAFGKAKPGQFKYIELFEHDKEAGKSSEKCLLTFRFSLDHKKGEWLWINRGEKMQGKQVKELAETITRAMKIKKCYLADSAKVKASNGIDEIALRIPLQVMNGQGYYEPLFSIAKKFNCPSDLNITGTDEILHYNQDPEQHKKDLLWLQNVPISTIFSEVFKGKKRTQELLSRFTKKVVPGLARMKDCTLTLQEFFKRLYAAKDHKNNYERAYFAFVRFYEVPEDSPIQLEYRRVTKALDHNMLLSAAFG